MRGEGQFMALFVKRTCTDGQAAENRAVKEIMRNGCLSAIPENGYSSAIAGKKITSVKRYIYEKNDEIYLIPNGVRPYPSLRYLMTGLHLATRKKDRVLPSQALSEALFEGEWGREFNMTCDDTRVMKYLRGETLSAFNEEIVEHEPALTRLLGDVDPAVLFTSSAGGSRKTRNKKNDKYILILIEGFPVGFGSFDRGLIKNKRAPGRRLL
jgi:NOL1/NOP2/fmu family ribosome biogenesis protein